MRSLPLMLFLAGCSGPTAADAVRQTAVDASSGGAAKPASESAPSHVEPSDDTPAPGANSDVAKSVAPPADNVAATIPSCTVIVEITSPDTYEGHSEASDSSVAAAAAKAAACTKFVAAERVDCDQSKQTKTNSKLSISNGTRTQSTSVTLARFWREESTATSVDGSLAACLAAQTAACQKALGTDCPAEGAFVVAVNGVASRRRLLDKEDL